MTVHVLKCDEGYFFDVAAGNKPWLTGALFWIGACAIAGRK